MTTEPIPFTARNVAKFALSTVVLFQTKKQVSVLITDHTSYETHDAQVEIPSSLIAFWTANQLSPVTNKIVDKSADFIVAARQKVQRRKAKKSETE